ncbi:MAG: PxKF domain-containing protein, partial [Actinomycetota bacterium]
FPGGDGYPGTPYEIGNASDLAAITGDLLDCAYVQIASFAVSSPWTPIGSETDAFRRIYDGAGFTISGLSIAAGDDYLGLFGVTQGATILNVTLTGVSITGDRFVGGLVGYAKDTTISNVRVSGAVKGNYEVGGIVGDLRGDADRSLLEFGFSDVTVAGNSSPATYVGGVAGYMYASTVSVANSVGSVTGENLVAGIVAGADSTSLIAYARASGAVSGATNVGGIVGYLSYSNVRDSYATGTVSASDDVVGGAVGYIEGTPAPSSPESLVSVADLERTYATGAVSTSGTAPQAVGGLVGYVDSNGTVASSHWSTTANPTLAGIGLSDNYSQAAVPGSLLATLQDIATYSGWTIRDGWAEFNTPTEVWGICDGVGTPYLLWEETESPCGGDWTVTGFLPPVDMEKVLNVAQAGRVVPLMWRIVDGDELPVSDPSSFVKIDSSSWVCAMRTGTVEDGVEKYVNFADMRYLGSGRWQISWATSKTWAGQCRTVTVELSDGTTISADFKFRR